MNISIPGTLAATAAFTSGTAEEHTADIACSRAEQNIDTEVYQEKSKKTKSKQRKNEKKQRRKKGADGRAGGVLGKKVSERSLAPPGVNLRPPTRFPTPGGVTREQRRRRQAWAPFSLQRPTAQAFKKLQARPLKPGAFCVTIVSIRSYPT